MASQGVWRGNLPEKAVLSKPEKRENANMLGCEPVVEPNLEDCPILTPLFASAHRQFY
jgi:hypothetical protein